jgi:hypothetical protein
MTRKQLLNFWSIAVGAMDALTGLWLIADPAGVLRLLRIAPPSPDALVFLSWIGVFVLGVGLSYGFVLVNRRWGEPVWCFTALVRLLVAVFLTIQILNGSLASAWALVAVADTSVAILQGVILRAQWWREVRR